MKLPAFNVVDSILISGFSALVMFTAYHLFKNSTFSCSDFSEGIMMMIGAKTGHIGANIADKYFNSPEDKQ